MILTIAWSGSGQSDSSEETVTIEIVSEGTVDSSTVSAAESFDTAAADTTLPLLEKEPVLKKFISAEYPPEYAKLGITGSVLLDILVNENGTVDSVGIVRGLDSMLDRNVADAARQFIFEPAEAGGQPVPVLITYEYRITLDAVLDSIQEVINFTGTVVERGTREPVGGVEIAVIYADSVADSLLPVPFPAYMEKIGSFPGQRAEGASIITAADSVGWFRFRSLPAGRCRVVIAAVGYEPFSSDEEIRSGELLEVTYRLQRVSYSEYEIVVYGKEETREVARRTLSVGEIRKIPGFGGDAVKVVQALPGVARPSFGGGAVVVRGAPSWDSKFYLDGIQIPQLYHFGGVKSTYNSEALSTIDFYPGGFSSRYGGAIAGIVNLEGRAAKKTGPHGFADVSLLDATAFAEGPVGKHVSVLASARRSYVGDLLGIATEKLSLIQLPVTVAPFYYDYIVRTDITRVPEHHIFFTLFGSKDSLELIVPFLSRGSAEVDSLADRVRQMREFVMGIGGWDFTASSGWKNSLRTSAVYGEGYGSIFGFARFSLFTWEGTVRDELSYRVNERLTLNAGFDLWGQRLTQRAVFPNPDNTFQKTDLVADFGLVGPWADAEFRPVERLLFIPGIRYDYYYELDYRGSVVPEFYDYRSDRYRRGFSGEPSLRLSARFEADERQTFKASVGTYNQTPQPQGFATNDAVGNPYLPATRARHIVAGYERRFTDLIFADIQLYHNQQWGIPEFATTADLLVNPDGPRLLPDGKGRMYGLELLLRHDNSERFFGWIAYTLARSERYSRTEGKYVLYNRDQTHNLQLVGSLRLPRQWETGLRLRYVSGNPRTPVTGRIFDVTNRFYRPLYGPENSARNDPFFQLDFRIDKKFIYDRWMFSLYLDLQNVLVFLYKSPEFTVYNYDFTEETSVSTPFIPSLGLRAEF
ncbi:MAG: TonB family protein [Chitinispirillaceae bacterium]|nr:TonB family protein [Chitinispirillaceae bacterium]